MKPLQIKSIDLAKYTELIVDKQPTEPEIKTIIQSYVDTIHPTHISIAIPLDQNAEFLARGHVPAPLTIDEFTRVWINAIHKAGVNVYFRGTFSGMKNLYDFGFDKETPVGYADTALHDGGTTWMGRVFQWLNTHLGSFKQGDIIGIIPDATWNAFDGTFFLPTDPNPQSNFLNFFIELKNLCDALTQMSSAPTPQIYTGFSSNIYKDIVSGWIPSFLYDLVGVMSVDYYGAAQTPVEIEKALNDLYSEFHAPIFLSEWSIPPSSINATDIDNSIQEFFEAFARLREKGILLGVNYFDGVDFNEGVFTDNKLNEQGKLLSNFFDQTGRTEPNLILMEEEKIPTPKIEVTEIKIEQKPTPKIVQPAKKTRKKATPVKKPVVKERTEVTIKLKKEIDYVRIIDTGIYMILGASLTVGTTFLFHIDFGNLLPYAMIVYTLGVMLIHGIIVRNI